MRNVVKKESWCILGGGALGLTLALRLAKRGQKVTLIEAAPSLGGLASSWRLGDVTWDRFYHVVLLSDALLRKILDELGLDQEIRWVQTKTGFYSQGKLHSLSSSLEFLLFPPLNLYEKVRLGGTIFFGSKIKNWRSMEQILVKDWLQRWSGKSVVKKIWLPLLKSKLGDAYERTSAAFIWAYIARMYAARRTGLKKEMFGYVPGGYATILAKFAAALENLGVEIQLGKPVARINRTDNGVSVSLQNGEIQQYDRVIATLPSPLIPNICPEFTPEEHSRHAAIEYLGVICTSLLLRKPLGPYYVTNITDDGIPLTGVIEMGTIVDPKYTDGKSLVYLPRYLHSSDERFQESDSAIHERCLSTLERMYPQFTREDVAAIQTARARYVMSLPTLDYSSQLPSVVSSIKGLYVLNSAQIVKGNLNVNETIAVGDELLEREIWPDFLGEHNA